jgi:hypothetical protein
MRSLLLLLLGLELFNVHVLFAAEEAGVGRLFSTPEQRSYLDALRESKRNLPVEAETVVHATVIKRKPVTLPGAISVQGYVKRTDGKKGTVWVNGEAVQEHSTSKDVQIGRLPVNGNRVPIRIPANGKRLTLKAGQVYDPQNNRVRESRSYSVKANSGRIGDANTP